METQKFSEQIHEKTQIPEDAQLLRLVFTEKDKEISELTFQGCKTDISFVFIYRIPWKSL